MKQKDFIEGVWYRDEYNKGFRYAKFLEVRGQYWYFTEYMYLDKDPYKHHYYMGNWELDNPSRIKADLSEIFDYLPDGHPDKIRIPSNEDLTYLIPILEKYNIK